MALYVCIRVSMYACMDTHMHTYMYMYPCMNACVYVCSKVSNKVLKVLILLPQYMIINGLTTKSFSCGTVVGSRESWDLTTYFYKCTEIIISDHWGWSARRLKYRCTVLKCRCTVFKYCCFKHIYCITFKTNFSCIIKVYSSYWHHLFISKQLILRLIHLNSTFDTPIAAQTVERVAAQTVEQVAAQPD